MPNAPWGKAFDVIPVLRTNLGAWSAGLASSGVLEMGSGNATRKTFLVPTNRLFLRCSTYSIRGSGCYTLDL